MKSVGHCVPKKRRSTIGKTTSFNFGQNRQKCQVTRDSEESKTTDKHSTAAYEVLVWLPSNITITQGLDSLQL
jgi:hypothetical protein